MESLEEIVRRQQIDAQAEKVRREKVAAQALTARNRAHEKKTGPINREADKLASSTYKGALLTFHERAGAILSCLNYIARHHGKRGYAFPKQQTIIDKLSRWYGVTMSRSTLNRDLRHMEDNGLLSRTRRHRARPKGGIEFNSTLYKFTKRGFRWLKAMRNIIFSTIFSRVSNLTQYNPLLRNKEDNKAATQPKVQAKEAPDGAVLA